MLAALTLSGLHASLLSLLEGRATILPAWMKIHGVNRIGKEFERLNTDLRAGADLPENPADWTRRQKKTWRRGNRAATRLLEQYPARVQQFRPTHFANARVVGSWQTSDRWGLDMEAAWPRIQVLMSAEQHQITTDAATELAFLVNATAVSGVVAVGGLVSLVVQHRPYQLVGTVVGVLAARTFYSLAVGAARRLSVEVQVPAVDMLRLAMYKRLGVRVPTSPDEEMEVGTRVSHLYTRMEAIPAELRRDVAMPEEEVPPADATQPEVHNK